MLDVTRVRPTNDVPLPRHEKAEYIEIRPWKNPNDLKSIMQDWRGDDISASHAFPKAGSDPTPFETAKHGKFGD